MLLKTYFFTSITQGGRDSDLPLGSIYVKEVHADGAAARTKRIREGDRILAVNGDSLENILHEEVFLICPVALRSNL